MRPFDKSDHYWIVGGDNSRRWSSASGGFVAANNATYLAWVAAGGAPTAIASGKELKLMALDAIYAAKMAAGAPVTGGKHVGLSDGSRADFTALCATAVAVLGGAGLSWPAGYAEGWITVENTRIVLPAASDALTLAALVAPYYSAMVQNNRTLKDAIAAAADQTALDAIDVSAGWP